MLKKGILNSLWIAHNFFTNKKLTKSVLIRQQSKHNQFDNATTKNEVLRQHKRHKKTPLLRMKGVYQAKKKYQALTLVRSGMINQISILV